jgi:DNA-binding transcriptional ArsR family regulator
VFGEQIKPILIERIERFFGEMGTNDTSVIEDQNELKAQLNDLVEKVVASFQKHGSETASRLLDEFEGALPSKTISFGESRQSIFIAELVKQMRDYFAVSDSVSQPAKSQAVTEGFLAIKDVHVSPALVERTLGPLANAWRIDILLRLNKESDSLAGLSKALGLKKGHLQFHLNTLLDSGYIQYERKSHLYSIKSSGSIALDEIARLIHRLSPIDQHNISVTESEGKGKPS